LAVAVNAWVPVPVPVPVAVAAMAIAWVPRATTTRLPSSTDRLAAAVTVA
jgi:hypothetical protein